MGRHNKSAGAAGLFEIENMPPHPERIERIRRWHIDQAMGDDPAEAMVSFAITSSGDLYAAAIAVEPEHAEALLPGIEELAELLRARAQEHAQSSGPIRGHLRAV